jgi:hypothetical protein
MSTNCEKLTKKDAAKAVARGCHKPLEPLVDVRHLEPFADVLAKLRRNCRYTISDTDSKRFVQEKAKA